MSSPLLIHRPVVIGLIVLSAANVACTDETHLHTESKINPPTRIDPLPALGDKTSGYTKEDAKRLPPPTAPSTEEITEIEQLVTRQPVGIGAPASDRTIWDKLAKLPQADAIIAAAETALNEPIPALTKEQWLRYESDNDRSAYQKPYKQRGYRLADLALGEALENKGRFLPKIEAYLQAFLDQGTWSVPAHGSDLKAYEGTRVVIDLHATQTVRLLATIDYWLADQLNPTLRSQFKTEADRRIFTPYLNSIREGQPIWWMTRINNWTAVCCGSITAAALAIEPDSRLRAEYIADALIILTRYIDTFSEDGISEEGINYWSYGFSNYLFAAEAIRLSTNNAIDLLVDDKVFKISQSPRNLEISSGIYGAFGDQDVTAKPEMILSDFSAMRYGLPHTRDFGKFGKSILHPLRPPLFAVAIAPFGKDAPLVENYTPPQEDIENQELRSWFPENQLFICRSGTAGGLGIALRGGNNGESHNHNDIGSYVVVKDKVPVLLDPGREVYTRLTFGPTRYESQMHNSFGHPVPLVSNRMQKTGASAFSETTHLEATPERDIIELDLTEAYRSPSLISVTRVMDYQRQTENTDASILITDQAEFDEPSLFSTALVTMGKAEVINQDTLKITFKDVSLYAQIDTKGESFSFIESPINGFKIHEGHEPKRIGIALQEKLITPYISVSITSEQPETGESNEI